MLLLYGDEEIIKYTWPDVLFFSHAPNNWDEDAREPSAASIPNDFPLEGRSVYVEAVYRFGSNSK